MPIYEYRCETCRRLHEVFSPMSERDSIAVTCCPGATMSRVYSVQVMIPECEKATFKPSPKHMKWFHSDDTQKKLKSGELEIYKPSRDDP